MGVSVHRGLCGLCVRVAKWFPVLFITAIMGWSYYAFEVHLCVLTVVSIDGLPVLFLLLVPYHVLFVLFSWSYWKTVFSNPGSVPRRFRLTEDEVDLVENAEDPKAALEQLAVSKDLPVFMRSVRGEVRYCSECSHIKPDRAHHCSVCNGCVLKMDHHCPWVNNCVGFHNYKFFVLFLSYAVAYCLFVALSSLKYYFLFWSPSDSDIYGNKFQVLFLFFVSAMFCISVLSLCGYHSFLVSRNQTTLESFRAPIFRYNLSGDKKGFFLGNANNFQEVFGDNRLLWFVPVFTSFGDGLVFPQRLSGSESGLENGLAGSTLEVDPELGVATTSPNGGVVVSNGGRISGNGGTAEEMVPMINATQFEDDESDEENDNVWTDKHNQRTTMAYSRHPHPGNAAGNNLLASSSNEADHHRVYMHGNNMGHPMTSSDHNTKSLLSTSSSDTSMSTTTAVLDVQSAVLDVESADTAAAAGGPTAAVSLRSPRLNRFESGANTSSAVTGELITMDTV